MLDDEMVAHNRFKRPHYNVGDRVRVTAEGPYHDWQGVITDIRAMQNMAGYVVSYYYTLRMDNLGKQEWVEERIAPLTANE